MVVNIDTVDTDSDDEDATFVSRVSLPAAKRATAPEGASPAYKARRRSQDLHAMRHLRTSPKIADGKQIEKAEILEPTDTLEQRLRFVSPSRDVSGPNSEAYVSGLARQMEKMCISHIQEVHQGVVRPRTETKASVRLGSESDGTQEQTQRRLGVWRECARPGSEKDIHVAEDDGWQIVEEYGERTPPRRSPLPSPERTSDSALSDVLAPSKSNPILSRSDTAAHFHWIVENLPYPEATYSIAVDDQARSIFIKTSNRKYYKRLALAELIDEEHRLSEAHLSWRYSQETLTVSYAKPSSAGPI